MKIVLYLFIILISGCATTGERVDSGFQEQLYVRKDMCPQQTMPEYHNYGEVVDKATYRRMPSYIQNCYQRSCE
ncbi:MAG: hypothetical protein PHE15_07140 [Dehalococcoidales bacterium]|nr:hypothetical protein [Dehalococcoidales bacterium]